MPLHARSRRRLAIVGGVFVLLIAALATSYVLTERNQDRAARASLEQGLAAFEEQRYDVALHKVGRFLQRFDNEATPQLYYVYGLSRLHNPQPNGRHVASAISFLGRAVDDDIHHEDARRELMNLRIMLGQPIEAEALALRVIDADPDDPTAWRVLAVAQRELRKFDESLAASEKLNQLSPDSVGGHLLTLSILRERGDSGDELVAYAAAADEASEGTLPTKMMLVNALILDGQFEAAVELVRSLSSVALADAESALQVISQFERLGGVASDGDLIRTAMSTAKQASERFDDPRLRRWLATRLLAEGDTEAVLDITRTLATDQPWQDDAIHLAPLRALALLQAEQADELDALLTRMAEHDQASTRRWVELIELIREPETATGVALVEAADAVLAEDRRHPYAMLWLAQGQIRKQQQDDAIETLGELVNLTPAWGVPRIAHLRLLIESGRDAEAAEHAGRALRLFNRSPDIAVLWAQASARAIADRPAGTNADMLTRIRQLRGALPDRAELAMVEIELLARLGQDAEAREVATAAIESGLTDAQLIQLSALGDRTGLDLNRSILAEAGRRSSTAPIALMRASQMVRDGDTQGAVALLESSLSNAEPGDEAAYRVALAKTRSRIDPETALTEWRMASETYPQSLSVQRAVLGSSVAWQDQALTRDAIDRFEMLVGQTPDWKLFRAQWLMRHGRGDQDIAAAADLLGDALRVAPDQAGAHRLLAEAMIKLGNLPMAESSLRQAATLQGNDPGVLLQLADLALRRADNGEAERYIAQANDQPLTDEHRIAMAQLQRRLGQPGLAVQTLGRVSAEADRRRVALLAAEALLEVGQPETALNTIRPWTDARDPAVWVVQARAMSRLSDGEGLAALRDRIDRPSALLDELIVLGVVNGILGDAEAAEAAYQRVIDQDPVHDRAVSGLLRSQMRSGRVEEADRLARQTAALPDAPQQAAAVAELLGMYAEDSDPTTLSLAYAATSSPAGPDGVLELGRVLNATTARLSRPDSALIRELGRLAQAYPQDTYVSNAQARALLGAQRPDDALLIVEGVIAVDPDNATAHGLRTDALMRLGRYRDVVEAVTRWREARGVDNAALDAVAARAALEMGDPDQAVAELTENEAEMLATMSETDPGLRLYISALAKSGRLDHVRDLLGPRLEDSPLARSLWANTAADYVMDPAEARAWLATLTDVTPASDAPGQVDLVMLNRVLGLRLNDESISARSQSLASELEGRDGLASQVWFRLGVEAERIGDNDAAERRYRKGFSTERQTAAIANNLAMVLARQDRAAEAIEFARYGAAWLPQEPEFQDTLAYALIEADRPAEAVEPLLRAIELDPLNPEWPLHLAEVYDLTGDANERDRLLKQLDRQTLSGQQLPADLRERFEALRDRSPSLSDAVLGATNVD
ncbi:MAG: tetratricopeptide repeat protein [Planctomycetota bacterium]